MKLLFENWRQYLNEEVLYHGSSEEYDFKDFDLEQSVGAIYFFPEEGLEYAIKYAKHDDFYRRGGFLYTVETEPNATILDLTDFKNYGDIENRIKAYIVENSHIPKEKYKDFILMNDPSYGMFDFLDYNQDFVNFLTEDLQIDGLKFVDGLPEVREGFITKVIVLLSVDSIATWKRRHLENETPT